MNKFILVMLIGPLIGTAAFADHHPDGLGLGGVVNFGWGQFGEDYQSGYFNPGLSLKIPRIPIYWGFFGNIKRDSMGFGLTGDYYIIDKTIVDEDKTNDNGTYRLKLGWYLGAGFFADMDIWNHGTVINVGGRVPGGISWYIIKKLELFAGIAPSFGVWITEGQTGFRWLINEEIGIRYWF